MTSAYAYVKIKKCPKSSSIKFAYVSGHFQHFKNLRAHTHARAFSRVTPLRNIKSPFLFCVCIDNIILSIWYLDQLSMTINEGMSVHQSLQHAHARTLTIGQIWAKTCLLKIRSSSKNSPLTPNFLSMSMYSIKYRKNFMWNVTSKKHYDVIKMASELKISFFF